jgi:hypothetical protein
MGTRHLLSLFPLPSSAQTPNKPRPLNEPQTEGENCYSPENPRARLFCMSDPELRRLEPHKVRLGHCVTLEVLYKYSTARFAEPILTRKHIWLVELSAINDKKML